MKKLLLLLFFLPTIAFGQGGFGSVVLPGNTTCDAMYISVKGCGGLTSLTHNGYTYDLVEIGGQCWFKENLQTTTYKDGTPINYPGTDNTDWVNDSTGAYSWYDNDSTTYDSIYGKLYNWYAVDNSAGLCPTGWHVPTDCEWMYLEDTLGMSTAEQENTGFRGTDEGGKLKEIGTTHWTSPNTGATNSSGFSALPGGFRYSTNSGNYSDRGKNGYWWSSSSYQLDTNRACYRNPKYTNSKFKRGYNGKTGGFSVRCLRGSACLTTYVSDTTSCDSYTWIDGNTYTTSNNTATHTLTNMAGCDSVVILNLTINNSSTATDTQTACVRYTWIDGNTYTSSNSTATHALTNAAGCDSVITLNLTINSVDNGITNSSPTLTANATSGTYQWLDCDNNYSQITGETNQSFTATSSGNYAVEVTQNNCTDTSDCESVTVVGLQENKVSNIHIRPNPTNDQITINIKGYQGPVEVEVYDLSGRLLQITKFTTLSLKNYSKGIYVFKVTYGDRVEEIKVVKD